MRHLGQSEAINAIQDLCGSCHNAIELKMPDTHETSSLDYRTINALIRDHGITVSEANSVLRGDTDIMQALERKEERDAAPSWGNILNNRGSFEVSWDFSPGRFHLSLDGASPQTFLAQYPDLIVMEADADQLVENLASSNTRSEVNWHRRYFPKTATVAYRWSRGRAITPPLVAVHDNQILILGGLHRFHLAIEHDEPEVPFLVAAHNEKSVCSLMHSARRKL